MMLAAVMMLAALLAPADAFLAPVRRQDAMQLFSSKDAEAEAQRAVAEFGKNSNEAKTAWDIVEEMRAAESGNPAITPNLDELCSLEESELCMRYQQQIEELAGIISQTNSEGTDVITRLVAENAVLRKQLEDQK